MPNCPVCDASSQSLNKLDRITIQNRFRHDFLLELPEAANPIDYEMHRCSRCTLEFAYPMTPGAEAFYNVLTAKPWYFPTERWDWDAAIKLMQEAGRKSVLDVGCGSGAFLKQAKSQLSLRTIGLDVTPSVVATCRAAGLEAYTGTIDQLSDEHRKAIGNVDCIVAFHTLEHVPDPLGFVRAMADVVSPGGSLLVSTPYSPQSYEMLWPDILNGPPHHMTRWNRKAYETLAGRLGMKASFHMPPVPTPWWRVGNSFTRWKKDAFHRRSKSAALFKMLLSPALTWREYRFQRDRDRQYGAPAADGVLVQMKR